MRENNLSFNSVLKVGNVYVSFGLVLFHPLNKDINKYRHY